MISRMAVLPAIPLLAGPTVAASAPSGTTTGVASQYGLGSFVLVAFVIVAALWFWRRRRRPQ